MPLRMGVDQGETWGSIRRRPALPTLDPVVGGRNVDSGLCLQEDAQKLEKSRFLPGLARRSNMPEENPCPGRYAVYSRKIHYAFKTDNLAP